MSDTPSVRRFRMRRRLGLPRIGSGGPPDRGLAPDTDDIDAALRAWDLLVEPPHTARRDFAGDFRKYHPIAMAACRIAYERDCGYVVIVDGEARWVADDTEACRLAMTARHAARILSLEECRPPVDAAV